MMVARRDFLKLLGVTAGAAGLAGCNRQWSVPARLVELALQGPGLESQRQTICGLCESGCGLTVRLVDGLPVGLKGNPRHPLNRGGICPVGQAGLEVLYSPDRLRGPLRRSADGTHQAIGWEDALAELSKRLDGLRSGAAGRIAILSGEPEGPLNDLARHFARAMGSSSFARMGGDTSIPYFLSQGLETPPAFDLPRADLVLSFGLDVYEDGTSPLYAVSSLIGARETEERATLLHVGTRLSPSAAKADIFLAIEPGTHAAAALGIAHVLVREGRIDRRFIDEHTFGFEDWTDDHGRRRLGFRRLLLERYYPERVARLCRCEPTRIIALARRLGQAEAPVVLAGGEALAGSNAVWTGMAVHSLNALLGAFERRGGVFLRMPIPLTSLPEIPDPAPGSVFDPPSGSAAFSADPVAAIADRVLDGPEDVDVLLVLNANPVHASPDGERLRAAMDRIDLVVACSQLLDETAAAADLILPAPVFLETWQDATAPSIIPVSVLGLAAPAVEPLHDSRSPGDVLLEVARRIGGGVGEALPWPDYPSYLESRLAGLVASGQGAILSDSFEESWVEFLERRGWRFLSESRPGAFRDDVARAGGWWSPVHAEGDWPSHFPTSSGRFEFFSLTLERRLLEIGDADSEGAESGEEALRRGAAALDLEATGDEACLPHFEPLRLAGEGELLLVPYRPITARGGLGVVSPMLLEMYGYFVLSGWQTWAELSPETARELDLRDGDRVSLESDRGAIEAVVKVRPGSLPGVVHVPLGLGRRETMGAGAGVGSNPLASLAPVRDPIAGTLSLTSTRVRPRLLERRRHGGPAPMAGAHA